MPSIPPYWLEFRREAVRLLWTSGRPIPQLAKELGCSPQSLRNWARQLDVDEGKAAGLTCDEREELRRLRRENRILAEERDILKKPRPSSPTRAGLGDGVRVHRREAGRALRQDDVPDCIPITSAP
jgi:transposase